MKQTAVEQLIDNLEILLNYKVKGEIEEDKPVFEMFQQALELEKQQIINAYLQKRRLSNISKSMKLCVDAEKYYNETYKKP